ncbi:MAG: hypothetical protein IPP32_12895 [Bacteroidetes bacterium]|nr:hypothetical protein [Bacteroidota bacterium]
MTTDYYYLWLDFIGNPSKDSPFFFSSVFNIDYLDPKDLKKQQDQQMLDFRNFCGVDINYFQHISISLQRNRVLVEKGRSVIIDQIRNQYNEDEVITEVIWPIIQKKK